MGIVFAVIIFAIVFISTISSLVSAIHSQNEVKIVIHSLGSLSIIFLSVVVIRRLKNLKG